MLIVLAVALRFAFLDRMAIEHFDEGVYASNIFFGPEDGNRYPYRHLYAPPLLPWLIEWCIVFLGPQGIAPFLPALVLGTATVPLAWWAVRCWFGPASGFAAGLLVATSDFHILYSRTALTDAPVAFFILMAVYLYWEAIRRESLRWSIAAGVATGLAWWTKYTGWLPLAIAAAGSLAWVIFQWRAAGVSLRVRLITIAKCFTMMAVTACLVWSPVLRGLQDYGGYAAVAENHAGYLRPWPEWGPNLIKQAVHLASQSGGPTAVGLLMFATVLPLASRWPLPLRVLLSFWCAATVGWTILGLGPAFPLAVLAAVGLSIELFGALRPDSAQDHVRIAPERLLAGWLLAAWFVGMIVATPFYQPYPRLAMPWLIAALLATPVWLTRTTPLGASRLLNRRDLFPLALLVLPIGMIVERFPRAGELTAGTGVPGWEDRRGLSRACEVAALKITEDRPASSATAVYVYETLSGPATFYQIAYRINGNQTLVVPAGSLAVLNTRDPEIPTYLVTSFRDLAETDTSFTEARDTPDRDHIEIRQDNLFVFPSSLVEQDTGERWLDSWSALTVLRIH